MMYTFLLLTEIYHVIRQGNKIGYSKILLFY